MTTETRDRYELHFCVDDPLLTDLAWAAGFFDGEGCTTYRADTSQICVSLPQVDQKVLVRWREAVGVGKIKGPYDADKRHNRQSQYVIAITNFNDAKQALERMWPWLGVVKRQQAILVLEAWVQETENGRRRHRKKIPIGAKIR